MARSEALLKKNRRLLAHDGILELIHLGFSAWPKFCKSVMATAHWDAGVTGQTGIYADNCS